jgi:Zn-finger nucleic acid-binding protein
MNNPAAGMPCPVCKVPLVMSERQGVEIDYCPTCRGVWLDRGELDKIVERAAAEAQPAASPPPRGAPADDRDYGDQRRDHGDHRHHPHKRRKSFFEDLFD